MIDRNNKTPSTDTQSHPLKTFAYARVSTQGQEDEGFSIPAQMKFLRDYAARQGLRIDEEIEEAHSARESGRPAFTRLLSEVRKLLTGGKGSARVVIIVEKLDRLTRNDRDKVVLSDLTKMGLVIHMPKDGMVWQKDSRSQDVMMLDFRAAIAKGFSANLSEEVRKGLIEKASRGLWPSVAPVGYKNDRETKTIVPHPVNGPAVRTLFEWAATGRYTLASLSDLSFKDGLRSRSGKKVNKSVIQWILGNPIYAGRFQWHNVMIQGIHEPLISVERFEEVQAALDKKAKPQANRHTFLFTGMMTCAACGCTITGQIQKGRYVYYKCAEGSGKCAAAAYAKEESLVEQFGEALKDLKISDDAVAYIRRKLLKSHEGRAKEQAAALVREQTRYTKLGDMKGKAYKDSLEGHVTMDDFLRTKAEIEAEMAQIETRMASLRRTDGKAMVEGVKIIDAVRHAHRAFMGAGQLEKRKILDLLLSNPKLDGKKAVITWKSPFRWMAEGALLSDWLPGLDSNQQPSD